MLVRLVVRVEANRDAQHPAEAPVLGEDRRDVGVVELVVDRLHDERAVDAERLHAGGERLRGRHRVPQRRRRLLPRGVRPRRAPHVQVRIDDHSVATRPAAGEAHQRNCAGTAEGPEDGSPTTDCEPRDGHEARQQRRSVLSHPRRWFGRERLSTALALDLAAALRRPRLPRLRGHGCEGVGRSRFAPRRRRPLRT